MIDPDDPNRKLVWVTRQGKVYVRRNRIDNIDPSKRSPARQTAIDRFSWGAKLSRGEHGMKPYRGQMLTPGAAKIGDMFKGPILARHIDKKVITRELVDRMEKESGAVRVTFMDELVAIVRG